jgi:hypothetical protein
VLIAALLASIGLGAIAQAQIAKLKWTWDDKLEAAYARRNLRWKTKSWTVTSIKYRGV